VLARFWASQEISEHHGRDILPGSRSIPCYARRGFPRNDLPNRITVSFTPMRTEADLPLMWMMTGLAEHLSRLERQGCGGSSSQSPAGWGPRSNHRKMYGRPEVLVN
jgi:hypothetical protein